MATAWQKGGLHFSKLSTPALEALCSIDFNKNKDEAQLTLNEEQKIIAWEGQYEYLLELIKRLEYGTQSTATDQIKAEKYRKKAKNLREKLKKTDKTPYLLLLTFESNLLTTEMAQAATNVKTPLRLAVSRSNRVAKFLSRLLDKLGKAKQVSGLGGWFSYLGLENAIEFIIDWVTMIYTTVKGAPKVKEIKERLPLEAKEQHHEDIEAHVNEAKKVGRFKRFFATLWKDSRPTRLANAILWVTINAIGIALAATTGPFAIPLIGLVFASSSLFVNQLNVLGTLMDIVIDAAGALYEVYNNVKLLYQLTKAAKQNPDFKKDPTFKHALDEIKIKVEESWVTRLIRIVTYDGILSMAMLFILFPPTAWLGVAMLGAASLVSAAGVLANWLVLKENPSSRLDNNRFDKGLSIAILALVGLATIGAIIVAVLVPPAGIPLALSMIGAGLALTTGLTGLARRAYRAWPWLEEKWEALKAKFGMESPVVSTSTPPVATSTSTPLASPREESATPASTLTIKTKEALIASTSTSTSFISEKSNKDTMQNNKDIARNRSSSLLVTQKDLEYLATIVARTPSVSKKSREHENTQEPVTSLSATQSIPQPKAKRTERRKTIGSLADGGMFGDRASYSSTAMRNPPVPLSLAPAENPFAASRLPASILVSQ